MNDDETLGGNPEPNSPNLSAIAEGFLYAYEERDRLFGVDVFVAPAWEVLLILQLVAKGLPAERLYQAINVPDSVIKRWVRVLQGHGLVKVTAQSGKELFSLTDRAREGMSKALASALRKAPHSPSDMNVFDIDGRSLQVRTGSLRGIKPDED